MKSELIYVELKLGHSGPAWIGYAQFSKTGQTVYFDGKVLKKRRGIISNHYDIDTGEEYWISGVKKRGSDRHWAGSGKISIDSSAVNEYLDLTGRVELPKNKFEITNLCNIPNKELSLELENLEFETQPVDYSFLYRKQLPELSEQELVLGIEYYKDYNPKRTYLKAKKMYKVRRKALEEELKNRKQKP